MLSSAKKKIYNTDSVIHMAETVSNNAIMAVYRSYYIAYNNYIIIIIIIQ